MRLRAILDSFACSPRRGRRDEPPARIDASVASRGRRSGRARARRSRRRRSVPAVGPSGRHARGGLDRGGGPRRRRMRSRANGARAARPRIGAARARGVSQRTVSARRRTRAARAAASRHRLLRDARRALDPIAREFPTSLARRARRPRLRRRARTGRSGDSRPGRRGARCRARRCGLVRGTDTVSRRMAGARAGARARAAAALRDRADRRRAASADRLGGRPRSRCPARA